MAEFIGRTRECERLKSLLKSDAASFVVIKGRRRVGKSTLIEHFSKEFTRAYQFTGLAPEPGVTADDQRKEFCRQYATQFSVPNPNYDDWGDIFWALGERVRKGRVLLFLDEISWMALGDDTYLPKLKDAWDRFFKQNPKLILVVCASASSWIESNLLSSTAFVGRVSFELTLLPLPLDVCKAFWRVSGVSAFEKLKVIAVIGGIPRYLEEIQGRLSSEENIKRLCFTPGGLLVKEFQKIFNDLFLHESEFYRRIVSTLSDGAKQFSEICQVLSLSQSGRITDYLNELEEVGFIKRYYSWSFKSGKPVKVSQYRLIDNYLRFYFKYIEPNLQKIADDKYAMHSLAGLPGWNSMMGLQVESLVINNRRLLLRELRLYGEDIIADGPYFQRATKARAGCQIDYLIQTCHNCLYIIEIRFSKSEVKKPVIDEVKEKVKRLAIPRGFSVRTVLVHVNGIEGVIVDGRYFSDIINIAAWLE